MGMVGGKVSRCNLKRCITAGGMYLNILIIHKNAPFYNGTDIGFYMYYYTK